MAAKQTTSRGRTPPEAPTRTEPCTSHLKPQTLALQGDDSDDDGGEEDDDSEDDDSEDVDSDTDLEDEEEEGALEGEPGEAARDAALETALLGAAAASSGLTPWYSSGF